MNFAYQFMVKRLLKWLNKEIMYNLIIIKELIEITLVSVTLIYIKIILVIVMDISWFVLMIDLVSLYKHIEVKMATTT